MAQPNRTAVCGTVCTSGRGGSVMIPPDPDPLVRLPQNQWVQAGRQGRRLRRAQDRVPPHKTKMTLWPGATPQRLALPCNERTRSYRMWTLDFVIM